jgi:hypothetical protein
VAENLPQQPAGQVPEIFCPHLLYGVFIYGVALGELAKDGVDPVAKSAALESAPFGGAIALSGAAGCE